MPQTYLLGASRAEDFHPSFMVGATQVVQPRLPEATAVEIRSRIYDLDIAQRAWTSKRHSDRARDS